MKKEVLINTQNSPDWVFRIYFKYLKMWTNQNVLTRVVEFQNLGLEVVLNTAAPICYGRSYKMEYMFSRVIATENVTSDAWIENLGENKLSNLKIIYGDMFELSCVVTDHIDDLPLMSVAKSVILVCPDEATLLALPGDIDYKLL